MNLLLPTRIARYAERSWVDAFTSNVTDSNRVSLATSPPQRSSNRSRANRKLCALDNEFVGADDF